VRDIVQMKTHRPLSEQINDSRSMPEHEEPKTHRPATSNIHYPKVEKEVENAGQPSPAPLTGFASKSYDGYYPPDPHGAVSDNYIVGTVNDELYIQDRSGNLISDVMLKNFWAPVHTTTRLFDPRLVYDNNTQRWFLVTDANDASDSSSLLVAASQTEDPTGTWNIYKIKADSSGLAWADYPTIAFNKNWVAITVNLFGNTSNYSDTGRIYLLNKNDLMTGQMPTVRLFDVDQGVCPAVTYDSSLNELYLLEVYSESAGQLQLLKISGAIGAETISSVGYPSIHMTWDPTPEGYGDFAPQLGDTGKIQCNDDRMGSVLVKNNIIYGTHTVFLPAGTHPTRSSVLWWAVATNGDVLQDGLIDDPASATFYAFPSIAVNKFNDALIGYSVFSAGQYASAGYSYHDNAQAAGSANDPYVFINGQNTYYRSGSGRNRWGDCSATVVDPLNDIDFWTINEYAESTADNWGSWWANVSGWDTINHDPATVYIAPNPNNGIFNIYILGQQVNTPVQVDIYDLLGQHVYATTSDNKTISVGVSIPSQYLSEGVYILRTKVNGQTSDKKMMIRY
jgi:hypothetical protein